MATTISFPADAVTNGASVIQASVFNPVTSDYARIEWPEVQYNFAQIKPKPVGFPTAESERLRWSFYGRVDLIGSSASMRNYIGIERVTNNSTIGARGSASGTAVNVAVSVRNAIVHNWLPMVMTGDNGTIVVNWLHIPVGMPVPVDPFTGEFIVSASLVNALYETIGFITKQTAAELAALTPLVRAVSGNYPLT